MSNEDEIYNFVSTIQNPDIKQFTLDMLSKFPSAFWTDKASRNYHPLDERGKEGNIIHTLRVARMCYYLGLAMNIGSLTMDMLKSAAILHDGGRYGINGSAQYTIPEHPNTVREIANINNISCMYSDIIFSIVESHMGKWGPSKELPQNIPQYILHFADVISANSHEIWTSTSVEQSKSNWQVELPFEEIGMTQEYYDEMKELAKDEDYWNTSLGFANSCIGRKFSTLSDKQQGWARKIVESLEEHVLDDG